METTTNEQVVLKAIVESAHKSGDTGVEYLLDEVVSETGMSKLSVQGVLSSLQKKGYIECFGDECYFDGMITENAEKWYQEQQEQEQEDNNNQNEEEEMETNEKRMTLSELAELINSADEWKLEFDDIIQANSWYSDYSEEESYKICQDETELLYFTDSGKAETRALEEDEVICSDKRNIETTYLTAVNWLHNSRILCNDICNIDVMFWDNCRFELEEGDEIFQFFLTNCSQSDVEFLEEHFGLLFAYSELLDLYVLCVNHYGTSWDSVPCYTDIETAAKINK